MADVGGEDFLELVSGYLENRRTDYSHDEDEHRLLKVTHWHADGRTLSGLVETGYYGHESNLYDVDQGKVTYRRQRNEAELLPFYFYMSLPAKADEGLVVLQRFQTFGIRTVLWKDLAAWLQNRPDLRVQLYPLAVGEAWKEHINPETVRAIRFVSFDIPHEIADALELEDQQEEVGTAEYVVRAKRGRSLPVVGRIREVMDGKREWNNVMEIDFPYDTVKVEVDFGGTRRTLELSNPEGLKVRYDITNEIDYAEDGHPDFASIDGIAREYAADLAARLGGGHA